MRLPLRDNNHVIRLDRSDMAAVKEINRRVLRQTPEREGHMTNEGTVHYALRFYLEHLRSGGLWFQQPKPEAP